MEILEQAYLKRVLLSDVMTLITSLQKLLMSKISQTQAGDHIRTLT